MWTDRVTKTSGGTSIKATIWRSSNVAVLWLPEMDPLFCFSFKSWLINRIISFLFSTIWSFFDLISYIIATMEFNLTFNTYSFSSKARFFISCMVFFYESSSFELCHIRFLTWEGHNKPAKIVPSTAQITRKSKAKNLWTRYHRNVQLNSLSLFLS